MLKYLFIYFVVISCACPIKAQSFNKNARAEFIDEMKNYVKSNHYVQKLPQFKDGAGDLYDYLQSHIIYPPKAKQQNLSAQVFITFFVDGKTGLTKDVKIEQSSNTIFNKEALRIVKNMPPWEPALQNDKDVTMQMTIPIYFHLD